MSQDGSDHRSSLSIAPGLGTLPHRGRQFRLYLWSRPLPATTWRREVAAGGFLQQIPVSGGIEL